MSRFDVPVVLGDSFQRITSIDDRSYLPHLDKLLEEGEVLLVLHESGGYEPTAIWDEEFSWLAAQRPSPHEHFDYQILLGYLAFRAGRMRVGVG